MPYSDATRREQAQVTVERLRSLNVSILTHAAELIESALVSKNVDWSKVAVAVEDAVGDLNQCNPDATWALLPFLTHALDVTPGGIE